VGHGRGSLPCVPSLCKGRALLSIQALAQFQLRGQSTREWAIHRWLILPGSSSQGISSCMPEEGIH